MASDDFDYKEMRQSDRKSPEEIVPVFNAITDERMGHIGNVSEGGMMLISRVPISDGHMYQIRFSLDDAGGTTHTFNVGMECLWVSEASSPDTYWAGFQIIDISDAEALALKGALADL